MIAHLHALGGIAAAAELEAAVLAERPVADLDRARILARAAVRAAVEVELAQDDPRLAQRRSAGGRVLLTTLAKTVPSGSVYLTTQPVSAPPPTKWRPPRRSSLRAKSPRAWGG